MAELLLFKMLLILSHSSLGRLVFRFVSLFLKCIFMYVFFVLAIFISVVTTFNLCFVFSFFSYSFHVFFLIFCMFSFH